jgi:hypothetical protein
VEDGKRRSSLTTGGPMRGARSQTVYVWKDIFDWVQFGWFEWPDHPDWHPDCQQPTETSVPERLTEYDIDGHAVCPESNYKIYSAPTPHLFRIENADGNDIFTYYYDDNYVASTGNMIFWQGYGVVGSERTGDSDTALAEVNNMRYEHGSLWDAWDFVCFLNCGVPDLNGSEDTDPLFKATKVSGSTSHLKVVAG